LHKALGQAASWSLIPRNPADSVKAPTLTPKEMHPLSAHEARRFYSKQHKETHSKHSTCSLFTLA
jgi:hypothetical protein